VASQTFSIPAFGQADLSNCEREQIHLAGSIQPHGALLVLEEPDLVVVQASENAAQFLNLAGDVVGRRLADIGGDLSARIRPHLAESLHVIPNAVRCRLGEPAADFDVLLHRPDNARLVIELERAGPAVDLTGPVDESLVKILAAPSLRVLCDDSASLFKALTGYDRVMVYRFDDDGHGEIFSEQKEPDLEPFLGIRYPASDIPQIARQLYMRNRIRVLVDVEYEPVPVLPTRSPVTGEELDMSLCYLRSMSPIHIQYLKNMGVGATLVASLVVGGKLWGLIACHNYSPRTIHYDVRAACELLAESMATRIAALESFTQAQAQLSVRRLEQRMIEAIARDGDWRNALFDSAQSILQPLAATGAALFFEGQVLTAGEVPGTKALRDIAAWLAQQTHDPIVATQSLTAVKPAFEPLKGVASGLVSTPVSSSPDEYLVWFRPEQIRTVTWGGNPFKPVIVGDDPADLSPRRSFSQWHQSVEGTCEAWSSADQASARMIGESIADVIHQFRAVRVLIAQSQLQEVSAQVRVGDQPVVIADTKGRVLLTNEAFEELFASATQPIRRIEDLPTRLAEPEEARLRLEELREYRRPWRGEIDIETELGETKPLTVRADPVFSSPHKVLGFVILFTDLSESRLADGARRRFQEGVIESHGVGAVRLDASSSVVYRNLLSTVIENAQLAALEITDGVEINRMPEMLEGVRSSVKRTAELLEHLIRHESSDES